VVDVDDLGAEHLGELDDLRAGGRVGVDLDQLQLALDRLVLVELDDLEHVHQLVELLDDLLELDRLGADDQRQPRDPLVVGRPTASEWML
jgi:hypothetical protein